MLTILLSAAPGISLYARQVEKLDADAPELQDFPVDAVL